MKQRHINYHPLSCLKTIALTPKNLPEIDLFHESSLKFREEIVESLIKMITS